MAQSGSSLTIQGIYTLGGCGFEMLAALEANFKPATFSHAFATLLSLVNDMQAEEGIHEFRACFEGRLHNMSRLMVSIPPILQAMLFLQALHPHYKAIIDLFALKQKDISVASINSIALDAQFMDELFSLVLMATLVPSRMMH